MHATLSMSLKLTAYSYVKGTKKTECNLTPQIDINYGCSGTLQEVI